jgi:protein tyrosine/serine phosphatase
VRFDLQSRWGRIRAWFYAMLVEHNLINLLRFNFHRVSAEAYRSSQPTMWQLRREVKNRGIKTIINLKGTNLGSAYYAFEKEQCAKLGVKMIDVEIYSRGIPEGARVRRAKEIFETAEYPIWMHCKAGVDRTSIYATFYQYFRQHIPIGKTDQLSFWPFGHMKHSNAGKIDYYLEQFLAYQQAHPEVEFLDWAENIADREKINNAFKPGGLASFLNDIVLRRE